MASTPFANCYELGTDFYEMYNQVIFKIADYKAAKEAGIPVEGMKVVDLIDGHIVGWLPNEEVERLANE